eukprot:Sspe_Gene.69718::Locus_41112_Transcript_1_1_Confidence_1.000_Length_941::g.69718::m.69718
MRPALDEPGHRLKLHNAMLLVVIGVECSRAIIDVAGVEAVQNANLTFAPQPPRCRARTVGAGCEVQSSLVPAGDLSARREGGDSKTGYDLQSTTVSPAPVEDAGATSSPTASSTQSAEPRPTPDSMEDTCTPQSRVETVWGVLAAWRRWLMKQRLPLGNKVSEKNKLILTCIFVLGCIATGWWFVWTMFFLKVQKVGGEDSTVKSVGRKSSSSSRKPRMNSVQAARLRAQQAALEKLREEAELQEKLQEALSD